MKIKATVTEIQQNVEKTSKAGKPYKVSSLKYKDSSGVEQETSFMTAKLSENPELMVKVFGIKPGDEIGIVKEKIGDYWQLADIVNPRPEDFEEDAKKPAWGGNKFGSGNSYQKTPEESRKISRLSVLSSVCTLFSNTQSASLQDIIEHADTLYNWVIAIEDTTASTAEEEKLASFLWKKGK